MKQKSKMESIIRPCFILVALNSLLLSSTDAATYYVAQNGSDNASGAF